MTPREPVTPDRSSAAVRAELDKLRDERDVAMEHLVQLEATYGEAVLAGDVEAEKHEAKMTSTKRVVHRAELRLPPLDLELANAEACETAERKARQQEKANAAVQSVVDEIETGYSRPACEIAA